MPLSNFTQVVTQTWQQSLGNNSAQSASSTEWLRSQFSDLRDRAGLLLSEINRDLPDFTRHDLSHTDALWEMADHIGGSDLSLNPVEGFVLGAVFLLHDAALSLAALPNRLEDLRRDSLWEDTIVSTLRQRLGRYPTEGEVQSVSAGTNAEVQQQVVASVLRMRHAEYAERIALQPYIDSNGEPVYLIQDETLRSHFGRDIGRISASHGRSLEKVSHDFARQPPLPPPAGRCPQNWKVDRLKLACLIRTCDAIHIDSLRAPSFLRVIRHPSPSSDLHWSFQQRISVSREDDRIYFSSGYAFPASEALAWWTGYELVQNADRELRQVDALLADLEKPRLMARSVFGADSPERLKQVIPTDGWEPVDARVKVTNVAEITRSLGGENLYGRHTRGIVPLRELIQNACDAVHARRVLEHNSSYVRRELGEITVRRGRDEFGHWVEVEDNGVGMSTTVLTGSLLDFGASLWSTAKQHEEWPGLTGQGFEPTGRFGIGFFSVFMWGERVRVTSQRFDMGRDTTRILEWHKGLELRPLIRSASSEEHLSEAGTCVRVWLTRSTVLTTEDVANEPYPWVALRSSATYLTPALDVRLTFEDVPEVTATSESQAGVLPIRSPIVEATDWTSCDGKQLLSRVWSDYYNVYELHSAERLDLISGTLRPLYKGNQVIGRACLFPWRMAFNVFKHANYRTGCITVGGLRAAELTGIAGVMTGRATRASRDEAEPMVDAEELARWATEQAPLFAEVTSDDNLHIGAATIVRRCGGHTGPLFITATGHPEGLLTLSHDDIVGSQSFPDEIIFTDFSILDQVRLVQSIRLHTNVFLTNFDRPSLTFRAEGLQHFDWHIGVPERVRSVQNSDWEHRHATLFGALIEAVAERWQCSIEQVIQSSTLNNGPEESPIAREIGTLNQVPLIHPVGLLRRPQNTV